MVEKLKLLVDLGVQQQAIATGMGVAKATVNQWVKGTRNPSSTNEEKFNAWLEEFKSRIADL